MKTGRWNRIRELFETACEHLFEGCMLLDGYLTDPHKLVGRMNQVLNDAAGLQQTEE